MDTGKIYILVAVPSGGYDEELLSHQSWIRFTKSIRDTLDENSDIHVVTYSAATDKPAFIATGLVRTDQLDILKRLLNFETTRFHELAIRFNVVDNYGSL